MGAIFGPAGTGHKFKNNNDNLSSYLKSFELKAYEYQCGMGVRISLDKAKKLGDSLKGITISIHAPYYISLSSLDEDKRRKSVDYILKTAIIAKGMGAKRIVVHSGSCRNLTRAAALELSKLTLKFALKALEKESFYDIIVCPETMGKVNQLGNLTEVLELCSMSENLVPCIDFGHLNARSFGGIKGKKDYEEIFNKIENKLGYNRLKAFHSHFSKIEYTVPGGEKKHLTFDDKFYGPYFEPLAELVAKKNLSPIFICESAGTQEQDAKKMKDIYENFL